jgi:hypothetical protein
VGDVYGLTGDQHRRVNKAVRRVEQWANEAPFDQAAEDHAGAEPCMVKVTGARRADGFQPGHFAVQNNKVNTAIDQPKNKCLVAGVNGMLLTPGYYYLGFLSAHRSDGLIVTVDSTGKPYSYAYGGTLGGADAFFDVLDSVECNEDGTISGVYKRITLVTEGDGSITVYESETPDNG